MNTGKESSVGRSLLVLGSLALVFLLSATCVISRLDDDQRIQREFLQATATAEASLTAAYGAEVSRIIENFELRWDSLEAYVDPSTQSEVATGPFLDYWGNARMGDAIYDESYWSMITSATVTWVRVLEYSSERIKAVASVSRTFDDVTPGGEIVRSSRPGGRCGIYVFVREGGTWKLAGFFYTVGTPREIQRDWKYAPSWLKEVIGELPDGELCAWLPSP